MSDTKITVGGPALSLMTKGMVAKATRRAARKGATTSARDMRSESTKIVRESKRIKAKAIRKAVKIRKNKGRKIEDMKWGVDIKGRVTRVSDYPSRQTRKGVSVEINRGNRVLIKSAFIATLRSGHKGVFKRVGKARLPIKELVATRALDVLRGKRESRKVNKRGQSSFEKTFNRLLPIELEKLNK